MSIIRDVTIKSAKYLNTEEILIFTGARQTGKTTILKQIKANLEDQDIPVYFLNLEDPDYLAILNKTPKNLFKIFSFDLNKKSFVLIDEIQYLKNPSNFLKFIFDEYKEKIKLIVSGSSAFYLDRKFKDSLAGRKKIFNVLTLSFSEFLRFKQENELAEKNFTDLGLDEKNKVSLYFREFMIFGGYPKVVLSPLEEKEDVLQEIAYSYIKKDVYEANIRQEEVFYKLFKILAAQTGSLVNSSELANTLNVSKTSIDNYLYVMRKSFHLVLVRPFFGNARKEITKMPKVFFMDLGLRNFFTTNFNQLEVRNDKGQLLENAVFKQLVQKYGSDEIRFWRTVNQKEVDFIVNNSAFEVKINPDRFRAKDYKEFMTMYTGMKFSIISIDANIDSIGIYPVINVWDL